MAKTRDQKKALLDQYKDALKGDPNYIIVDTDAVSMAEVSELKKELREHGGKYLVLKNTLFKIAAQDAGQPTRIQEITSSSGVIVCGEDPTASAKALKKIQDEHEVMETKFAILFGEVEEPEKVAALAEIPPKDVLLAQLVGSFNGPLSGFAQVLQGNVRDFVYALSEIQKKKGDAAE